MRDHSTSRSRGFGFVTFDTEQAVDDLLSQGNKLELAGAQVSRCPQKSTPLYYFFVSLSSRKYPSFCHQSSNS